MGPHLDAIACHTTLTRLELQGCDLTTLPVAFSSLSALRHLDLSENGGLDHGWEHLAGLAGLTRLVLTYSGGTSGLLQQYRLLSCGSFTWMQSLALGTDVEEDALLAAGSEDEDEAPLEPPALQLASLLLRFTHLASLELVECMANALPSPLSSLVALRSLSLYRCGLAEGALERLPTQLTSLDLTDCGIQHLPARLSLCTGLQSLSLQGRLSALSALERLDVGDSRRLTGGLAQLSGCSRLACLQADYCPDIQVDELSGLAALRVLGLAGSCRGADSATISARLHAISGLRRLEAPSLAQAQVAEVPAAIAALSRLSSLDLSWTEGLATGWQHLAHLGSHLASLNLSGSALAAIPPQLSCLQALQRLRLDDNPALGSSPAPGWHHLLSLPCLTRLSLLRCKFAQLPQQLGPLRERARIRF
ncbi:hypothetical protein ABPG75_012878 [Micractinium tetrahymenae]